MSDHEASRAMAIRELNDKFRQTLQGGTVLFTAGIMALATELQARVLAAALAVLVTLVALSMVSNIRYRSFKDVDFRDKMPFVGMIVLVLVISIIYLDPPLAFLAIGCVYLLSGTIIYAIATYRKIRSARSDAGQSDD